MLIFCEVKVKFEETQIENAIDGCPLLVQITVSFDYCIPAFVLYSPRNQIYDRFSMVLSNNGEQTGDANDESGLF